jgi:hypothetical protein
METAKCSLPRASPKSGSFGAIGLRHVSMGEIADFDNPRSKKIQLPSMLRPVLSGPSGSFATAVLNRLNRPTGLLGGMSYHVLLRLFCSERLVSKNMTAAICSPSLLTAVL